MTPSITKALFDMLDKGHTPNELLDQHGRRTCRVCGVSYPCDVRMLIDSHKQLSALVDTQAAMNMAGYRIIAELVDCFETLDRLPDRHEAALDSAREYLQVGRS